MPNPYAGTVRVEFAGTREEARALAKATPGITAPNRTSCNGFPVLSAPFKGAAEREAAQARLEALGWEREFQEVKATHEPQPRKAA